MQNQCKTHVLQMYMYSTQKAKTRLNLTAFANPYPPPWHNFPVRDIL